MRKSSENSKDEKKILNANAKALESGASDQEQTVTMCIISQANLQAIHDWLNSDSMLMPQNQVRYQLRLINSAKLIEVGLKE
ncbi:MAG: hypothetical protein COA71_14590 [SAR86 cluster bacterium]|uniref:Uncharacterized protein n=1 Tax=SAR86 cluster bacterium TaxID=2030880 RepID=A0A2A5C6Q9_9GAMM|nr:MAG: hypothetical protein COA71_14590 [SAR86 cluster bacterium]